MKTENRNYPENPTLQSVKMQELWFKKKKSCHCSHVYNIKKKWNRYKYCEIDITLSTDYKDQKSLS